MSWENWTVNNAEQEIIYKGINLYARITEDEFTFRFGKEELSYGLDEQDSECCKDKAERWFDQFSWLIDYILDEKINPDATRACIGSAAASKWKKSKGCTVKKELYGSLLLEARVEDTNIEFRCGTVLIQEKNESDSIHDDTDRLFEMMKSFIDYVKEHGK